MKGVLGVVAATLMTLILAVGPARAAAPTAAPTTDETAILAVIQQFADALNKNDPKAAAATQAATPSIIDDVPPHAWQGPTAFADWLAADTADMQKHGITDPVVKLTGKPKHLQIDGDTAYVVRSATYTYKLASKKIPVIHGIMTFSMAKSGSDWKIAAWAWANLDK